MTVAELISELQRQPQHVPVKVALSEIYGGFNDQGQFDDEMVIPLGREEAIEADIVRFEGSHVLIESK